MSASPVCSVYNSAWQQLKLHQGRMHKALAGCPGSTAERSTAERSTAERSTVLLPIFKIILVSMAKSNWVLKMDFKKERRTSEIVAKYL